MCFWKGFKAHLYPTVKTDTDPFVRIWRSFHPSVDLLALSLRIRSAPDETEQYHRKSGRQYRVRSHSIAKIDEEESSCRKFKEEEEKSTTVDI